MSLITTALAFIPKSVLAEGGVLAIQEALKLLADTSNIPAKFTVSEDDNNNVKIVAVPRAQSQTDLKQGDLTDEDWREYDFGSRVYRIGHPKTLYYRTGGTTHRIVDADGVVHCVPVPGNGDCVLRWKCKEGMPPVQF